MAPGDVYLKLLEAFNAGDLDALMELYEPDAVLAPTPVDRVRGKDAIRAAFAAILKAKPKMRMELLALFESGDLAMTKCQFTAHSKAPDGSPLVMNGVTAEVLRRQPDGRWLFVLANPFAG